jgi:hypothetical protein
MKTRMLTTALAVVIWLAVASNGAAWFRDGFGFRGAYGGGVGHYNSFTGGFYHAAPENPSCLVRRPGYGARWAGDCCLVPDRPLTDGA